MSFANQARLILSGEPATTAMLVDILIQASDDYHNSEEDAQLTDDEFNMLENMLRAQDPKNLYFSSVGSEVRGGKVDLPYPMGSLDQAYEGDTVKWIKDNKWSDQDVVLSDKQDGTSALLVYQNGKLKIAFSRGDGFKGADITRHISKIKQCPQTIPEKGMVVARCEVIFPPKVFEKMKATWERNGQRTYRNPRNYVAGRMNASESPAEFYDNVQVIATSIVEPKMGKEEQFKTLENYGFIVTPYVVKKGNELNDSMLTKFLNDRREVTPTEIDGIVIDIDNADIRASLRRNSSSINPMYSRKFKIASEDNVAITEVIEVEWNPSKAGYLKPRVRIQPVDLMGVTINHATGFNAKFIRDNLVGPGAKVQITRAGDVIPFIQQVVEGSPTGAQMPSVEEFGLQGWTDGNVDLLMLNPESNRQVQLEIIITTFDNSGLNVPHLREGSVEKLYDAGFTTVESIIKATEAELVAATGQSAGKKIFEGLQKTLGNVELGILAGSTSIIGRGIGRRKMTKLVEALGQDAILVDTIDEKLERRISDVEGFGENNAQTIVENLGKFRDFLKEINGYYTLVAPKEKVSGGDLASYVFCFTGFRDGDAKDKIESRSGTVLDKVNKDVTHVVTKDPTSNSSKIKKARELGITIWSPVELMDLLK